MVPKAVTLIIPVYNEQEAIVSTIGIALDVLSTHINEYEILIVNDGSTDATVTLLEQYADHAHIRIIEHAKNQGNGAAIVTGMHNATYNTLATVDADGTYPIDELPRLLQIFNTQQADMVVGKRAKENDETSIVHRAAAGTLNIIGSFLTWHHIPDINSGLRVFTKDLALRYVHLYPKTFSFHITLTLSALFAHMRVLYVNIDYFPRIGESKLSSGLRGPYFFAKFIVLMLKLTVRQRPIYIATSTAVFILLFKMIGTIA